MPLLQFLVPQAYKQAIKCYKERKITALPNKCHNIPFFTQTYQCLIMQTMHHKTYTKIDIHQIVYWIYWFLICVP